MIGCSHRFYGYESIRRVCYKLLEKNTVSCMQSKGHATIDMLHPQARTTQARTTCSAGVNRSHTYKDTRELTHGYGSEHVTSHRLLPCTMGVREIYLMVTYLMN